MGRPMSQPKVLYQWFEEIAGHAPDLSKPDTVEVENERLSKERETQRVRVPEMGAGHKPVRGATSWATPSRASGYPGRLDTAQRPDNNGAGAVMADS